MPSNEIEIHSLKQDKKNSDIKFFSALPLCVNQTPQGQKHTLNHKDPVFSFWCQPCNSLEDNILYHIRGHDDSPLAL